MGHKDLDSLYPIYQECKRLNDEFNFGFNFKFDSGDWETRLDINEDGNTWAGNGKLPLTGYLMFCPDILDYHNKIIIEFEEECKPNKGDKRRKGHFEGNKWDVRRDWYYTKARFDLLKIWKSNKDWKEDLKQFLIKTYAKRKISESDSR